MKRRLLVTCMAGLLLTSHAAASEAVDVLGVTAIAETQEEGEKFVAVAIQYSEPLAATAVTVKDFVVANREVRRVYVNSTGNKGDVQSEGNYVVVELAVSNVPGSPIGSTLYYGRVDGIDSARLNHRLPIEPVVSQTRDLTAVSGNIAGLKLLDVTEEVNPLADTFIPLSFSDPASGMTVGYRLYIPTGYEENSESLEPLPLVVMMHGSGERGSNNQTQLLANPSALEFAREEAQKEHPSFVLAPQNPDVTIAWARNDGTAESPRWVTTPQIDAVKKIIDQTLADYSIDRSRIYCTGLSQGSKGTMRLSMDNPELCAAQLNSSGVDQYSDDEVAALAATGKPIWALIAVDDLTNPATDVRNMMVQFEAAGTEVTRRVDENGWDGFLRGPQAEALAREQWTAADAAGAHVLYTEYIAGTVLPVAHFSWMANFSNHTIRDWLFSQVNPKPYEPPTGSN